MALSVGGCRIDPRKQIAPSDPYPTLSSTAFPARKSGTRTQAGTIIFLPKPQGFGDCRATRNGSFSKVKPLVLRQATDESIRGFQASIVLRPL
jgi:hypothetical protein